MRGDFDERNGSVVGVSDERLNGGSGRLGVFSLTRNGPELDAETSELGPDQHLCERR